MARQTDIEKNQAIKESYLATLERRTEHAVVL